MMKILSKVLFTLLLTLTLHFSFCVLSFADIPHLINYQGKLTDTEGKPVSDGVYSLTFRIYDAETAGILLWEETQSVNIQKGIFNVMLGGVTNLNLAFDVPYWLEIKVGSEVMSPRQGVASVGYAIRAETAENSLQAQNANTVANVGVSTTPTPHKILPLDSNAKLPASVLKVYDSDWFSISLNNTYTKIHNLGTTKLLIMVYSKVNSGDNPMLQVGYEVAPAGDHYSYTIKNITPTQFDIVTSEASAVWGRDYASNSGYYRVIALALE